MSAPFEGPPALPFATTAPQTVPAGSSRAKVMDLMRALRMEDSPVNSLAWIPTGGKTN